MRRARIVSPRAGKVRMCAGKVRGRARATTTTRPSDRESRKWPWDRVFRRYFPEQLTVLSRRHSLFRRNRTAWFLHSPTLAVQIRSFDTATIGSPPCLPRSRNMNLPRRLSALLRSTQHIWDWLFGNHPAQHAPGGKQGLFSKRLITRRFCAQGAQSSHTGALEP